MSDKIKILAISYSLGGGGAERQFMHLLNHLDKNKFDLAVCLLKASGVYMQHLPADIKVYDLGLTAGSGYPKAIYRLRKIIVSTRPQVVYSRLWDANIVSILAGIFLKKPRPGVIINETTPLSQGFERANFKHLRKLLTGLIYPRADTVIAISSRIRQDLTGNFNIPADKITFIPNMVDITSIQNQIFQATELSPQNGIFTVASMGRLSIEKGYAHLIKAIKIVNRKFPCQLQILGTGPEEEKLKALAAELGMSDKVNFPGFQENPFGAVKGADVFAMASLYEGMSGALLEAMALGMPIIFTDVSGVRDVAEDGREIIIVPPATPEIMAEKIIFLKENHDYGKQLSENAKKRAADFSTAVIIKKFEDLFINLSLEGLSNFSVRSE